MAISRKRFLTVIALIGLLLFSIILVYEAYFIHDALRFNRIIERKAYHEASAHESINGLFARAYVYQQRGEFDQAVKTYAKIEKHDNEQFSAAAKYNMANLYLHKALVAQQRDERDIAIPLIELAKQNYRELLRINNADWQTKYNLERALQLYPDILDQDFPEDVMPERSPEAAGVVEMYYQLP